MIFKRLRLKIFILILGMGTLIGSVVYFTDPNLSLHRFFFNRAQSTENSKPSKERLTRQIAQGIPSWIQERVKEELKPFSKLDTKNLDIALKNLPSLGIARFKIKQGKVSIEGDIQKNIRLIAIKESLENLCNIIDIPDLEFLFTMEDMLKLKREVIQQLSIPIFVFARGREDYGSILYPHFSFFTNQTASYCWITHILPHIEKALKHSKWESKKEIIFWRGATTGIDFSKENWKEYPRAHLCTVSQNNPSIIDAKFTYIGQASPEVKREIVNTFPCGEFVSPEMHLNYKYLICVDGNTCTSPGLYWRLLSDSVTFKQETDQIEHFYNALIPFEHYIPIKEDLSDLLEKVQWAKTHDDEAKRIAKQSTEFVYDHLTLDATYLYIYHLLIEYSKLFSE